MDYNYPFLDIFCGFWNTYELLFRRDEHGRRALL